MTYEGTSHAFHVVGSEQTRVYANAGQTVTVEAVPLSVIADSQVTFSFSGYLVNAS
jgi:phage baseplate assembly protein gpV